MKSIIMNTVLACLMLNLNWDLTKATFNGKGGVGYGHEAGGHGGHGYGYGKGGGGESGGGTSCIVKGSYCQCHYCKCEHGQLHCGSKKGGYGHDKG